MHVQEIERTVLLVLPHCEAHIYAQHTTNADILSRCWVMFLIILGGGYRRGKENAEMEIV